MKYCSYLLVVFLFLGFNTAFSQTDTVTQLPSEDSEDSEDSEAVGIGFRNPQELEIFLDGVMTAHFETYHLAGAVVSIVKDGELFFSKGYGFSDVENRKPADPASSLFRIGSITKLFTWTAVMQLVDQGKLNPEADVNTYLQAFKVPNEFLEPVKMTHLMTHTAGFEDRALRLFARSPDQLLPLEEILSVDLPARIRPPGKLAAYSNHGSALAGYIVERISGLKWEDYVDQNILKPLSMNSSTVTQPVPAGLESQISGGYAWQNGRLVKKGFEFVPASPAGAASATALDMANFMIAFLQSGRFGEKQILEESSVDRMLSLLFTHDPRVSGMGYGFIHNKINNQLAVGHGGDTFYFHSILLLLPEHNTGLFVSYNSDQGGQAAGDLTTALFDRYFPVEFTETPQTTPGFEERLSELTGIYRSTRRSETTIDKIGELISVVEVQPGNEKGLIQTVGQSDIERWVEIDPYVFRNTESHEKLVFKTDDPDGRILGFLENVPIFALERMRWYETPGFHSVLFIASSLILLTSLLLPIVTMLINIRGESLLARRLPTHPKSRALAASVSALLLLFYAGLAFSLRDPMEIVFGVPPFLGVLIVLPIIAAILTTILPIITASAWRNGYWGLAARIHYTLVFLAAVATLWQLNYWNFLGWYFY